MKSWHLVSPERTQLWSIEASEGSPALLVRHPSYPFWFPSSNHRSSWLSHVYSILIYTLLRFTHPHHWLFWVRYKFYNWNIHVCIDKCKYHDIDLFIGSCNIDIYTQKMFFFCFFFSNLFIYVYISNKLKLIKTMFIYIYNIYINVNIFTYIYICCSYIYDWLTYTWIYTCVVCATCWYTYRIDLSVNAHLKSSKYEDMNLCISIELHYILYTYI